MRYDAEPAYVLHTRPWRESSLLVEVLSANHGRLGLLARGVQGPKRHVLRAALQPMQFIRLDAVQRGELAQLRAAGCAVDEKTSADDYGRTGISTGRNTSLDDAVDDREALAGHANGLGRLHWKAAAIVHEEGGDEKEKH